MKVKAALLILLLVPLTSGLSAACEKGSDDPCKRFGENFCCAYIDIKSEKEMLKGFWCADKKYAGEEYDYAGYSGKIICSGAENLKLVIWGAIALLITLFI